MGFRIGFFFVLISTVVLVIGMAAPVSAINGVPCPEPGNGLAGVEAWIEANCGPEQCENPATTCNGEFTIEFLSMVADDEHPNLVTFTYEVCRIGGAAALSHWSLGLGGIDCLGDGFDLEDLVVKVTMNDEEIDFVIGLDPTTQLYGLKFDEGYGDIGDCNEYAVTFDTDVLAEGYTLGTGCVPAATKAGNQDITREDRDSPGYACIIGPVCEEEMEEYQGCSAGFWKNHTDLWVGYDPDDKIGDVFTSAPDALKDFTLLEALDFGGGRTLLDKQKLLLRQAVAALLNAANGGINYPMTEDEIKDAVNAQLSSGTASSVEALKDELDGYNNLGCPLGGNNEMPE